MKIIKSKIYVNLFFTICFLSTLTFGQSQDSAVKIRNLKNKYGKKERISFQVENTSIDTVHVKIGVEEYKNNEWIVLAGDIFKNRITKTSVFVSLRPNASENIEWIPYGEIFEHNTLKFEKIKIKGKYRFFVFWGTDPKHIENKFISSAFIKK